MEIITALVGPVVGAVVGGITTPMVTERYNNKSLRKFSKSSRFKAVSREWRGEYTSIDFLEVEMSENNKVKCDITVDLNSKGKSVSGTAKYDHIGPTTLILKGGFRNDSELILNYENEDKSKVNYGCMLLKLNGNGNKLSGYVIGIGRNPDGPFASTINLY